MECCRPREFLEDVGRGNVNQYLDADSSSCGLVCVDAPLGLGTHPTAHFDNVDSACLCDEKWMLKGADYASKGDWLQ